MSNDATANRRRWADVLKMVVFLGIGVFFIYWFLLKLDATQKAAIWQSFLEADYRWVAACIGCSLLSHLLRALRWRLLFSPMGHMPSVGNTFGSVMIAYLGNLAFPRAGEVMRCATLRTSEGIPIDRSLGTVVTERIVDLLAFVLIVVIGLLAMYGGVKDWLYDTLSVRFSSLPGMGMVAGVVAVALAAAFVAYKLFWKRLLRYRFFRKVDDLVRGMLDGLKSIFHLGAGRTAWFLALSAGIYLLYIVCGLVLFQAFQATSGLGLTAAFAVYLFGTVGMTFSQGGIGVYPVLVQLALEIYGVPLEVGTACGWLLWAAQQALVIVVGGAFMVYFSLKKNKQK
ncbi:MAG: flippase-like domain-containing protein [Bacteroidales bacterium]|nr:flippase-like domain-containing protein [Bacteroidales bacterium]